MELCCVAGSLTRIRIPVRIPVGARLLAAVVDALSRIHAATLRLISLGPAAGLLLASTELASATASLARRFPEGLVFSRIHTQCCYFLGEQLGRGPVPLVALQALRVQGSAPLAVLQALREHGGWVGGEPRVSSLTPRLLGSSAPRLLGSSAP